MSNPNELQADPFTQHFPDVPVLQFTRCTDYNTFTAEWAVRDKDLVFHFFTTKEQPRWSVFFAPSLDKVAQSFFNAGSERLMAVFTDEVNSWMLLARGFAVVGNPAARAEKFFAELDAELDRRMLGK